MKFGNPGFLGLTESFIRFSKLKVADYSIFFSTRHRYCFRKNVPNFKRIGEVDCVRAVTDQKCQVWEKCFKVLLYTIPSVYNVSYKHLYTYENLSTKKIIYELQKNTKQLLGKRSAQLLGKYTKPNRSNEHLKFYICVSFAPICFKFSHNNFRHCTFE